MPAFQPTIVHPEGYAVHTFNPESESNGVFSWKYDHADGPAADITLTGSVKKNGSREVTRLRMAIPVALAETATSPAQVIRTAYVDVSLSFDKLATDAERDFACEAARNLFIDLNPELNPALCRAQNWY